jgi:ABC-2 type transport system permease protein
MTTTAPRHETAPARQNATGAAAFQAMLLRDLRVVRKTIVPFLMRTVMQPFFIVFVFAYVFPEIGQGIGGSPEAEAEFATLLAPGVIASAIIFQGIQAVTLPLVSEFGYTREIEDRVMAPLPIWGNGFAKVVSGALQAALAGVIVYPMLLVIPSSDVDISVSWLALLTVLPLSCLLGGSLGLVLGTRVEPRQVSLMFSIIVMPMMMLGCVYYPWARLDALPVLQWAVLVNPLVYMSEGFRMALTSFDHMNAWAIYGAMLGATVLLLKLGIDGFTNRVLS